MFDNEKIYGVSKSKLVPIDQMIEAFVKYYGEKYREQITSKLHEVKIVLAPTDVAAFKIKEEVLKKYKNLPEENLGNLSKEVVNFFKAFANNHKSATPERFEKVANIAQSLGFDVSQILIKDAKTNKLTFDRNSEESKKLINYIKSSNASEQIVGVNIEEFFSEYESALNKEKLEDQNLSAKFNQTSAFNLVFEEGDFFNDIITTKGPVNEWSDEYTNYFLAGINRNFNKNLSSMSEFFADESLGVFRGLLNKYIKKSEMVLNRKNFDEQNENNKDSGLSAADVYYFEKNPYLEACQNTLSNEIIFPVNEKLNLSTVMHEANHVLGTQENKLRDTGFSSDSVGFNEILNEYLTQKALENMEETDIKNLSISKKGRECVYNSGVKFMQPFLQKFEPVLKKCQMSGNAADVLKDFVGEKNYKTLMTMCGHLEKIRYGNLILSEVKYKGSVQELVVDFKKDPNNELFANDENFQHLTKLEIMNNFMQDMIENYANFTNGKVSDVEPRSSVDIKTGSGI